MTAREVSFSDPERSFPPLQVIERSPISLGEKLVKIGAKVVRHGRYVRFQSAEAAVLREQFLNIQSLIDDLRPGPALA
jgi:hypothetical protein